MTKLIKKKDCKFKNCQIVKGDKLVGIPHVVWMQLNKLEVMLQQYSYLKQQPCYQPGPSLEGFVRKSALDKKMPYVKMPETPVSDARVEEAMRFMAEVDAVSDAVQANEMIDRFKELVLWADGKKFVEGDCTAPIDTWFIGDPLRLDGKAIARFIEELVTSPIQIEG